MKLFWKAAADMVKSAKPGNNTYEVWADGVYRSTHATETQAKEEARRFSDKGFRTEVRKK